MELDATFLARVQFAFVISFHILFPAFTIGLAGFIALLETTAYVTGRQLYASLSRFWTKIFAISFGMGVVSGIVMSYQLGLNWSAYAEATANVLGPLFSYEVLTAFFLEASFLGILLFGRDKVPPFVIVLSAIAVAVGTVVSAFWILAANSWMHTPAGYEIIDGTLHVVDWWAVIFNPSFPYRLLHMVVACFLTTALVVSGVGAWYVLRGQAREPARKMLSMALWLITVLAPTQILLGDLHGLNTFEYQPAKVAAMEGHWETQRGAPLVLFGWPDMEAAETRFEVAVPKLGSLILTHEMDGEVRGLKEWPREEWPFVPIVFWSFRIMVGIGLVILGVALWSVVLRWRGSLYFNDAFLRTCVASAPLGFIAILAGWFTTEVGRQPWIVYGLMRTSEGVSPTVEASSILVSLVLYVLAYAVIFGVGTTFILREIRRGPERPEAGQRAMGEGAGRMAQAGQAGD